MLQLYWDELYNSSTHFVLLAKRPHCHGLQDLLYKRANPRNANQHTNLMHIPISYLSFV